MIIIGSMNFLSVAIFESWNLPLKQWYSFLTSFFGCFRVFLGNQQEQNVSKIQFYLIGTNPSHIIGIFNFIFLLLKYNANFQAKSSCACNIEYKQKNWFKCTFKMKTCSRGFLLVNYTCYTKVRTYSECFWGWPP